MKLEKGKTLTAGLKILPLFAFSLVEMTVAFVRMIILTHMLGPYEFGFAAAISATYATFELITDIAIYRFVLSSPRSSYAEAVAGAHAFAIIRGVFLAGLILSLSQPISCVLVTCNSWSSFAWLAPIPIIKSFENFQIRVAERDYRYWPQFITSILSHGCGLIALTLVAYRTESHYAFIAYLLAQSLIFLIASHSLASSPYQVSFRTPLFRKAVSFGWPLVLNGIGLAILSQGDRLMVGVLFGPTFLGFYAVIILCALVPLSGLFRILGPIQLAGLYNANVKLGEYDARLQLFSRIAPIIGAFYAIALMALLVPLIPVVFGERFAISNLVASSLAVIAFLRIVRAEPHTSILIQTHNTRRLALANQVPIVGLLVAGIAATIYRTVESVLVGIAVGDMLALLVTTRVTQTLSRAARSSYVSAFLTMLVMVIVAGYLLSLQNQESIIGRIAIACGFFALMLAYASIALPKTYHRAYGQPRHERRTCRE